MSKSFVIANFSDKKDGAQVAHIKCAEGVKVRGSYRGITPELILLILDDDQAALRTMCNQSIAMAAPKAKAAPAAPPAPPVSMFYTFDGAKQSDVITDRVAVMQFATANRDNPAAAIHTNDRWYGKDEWAAIGFMPPAPPVAPAPPAPPAAPAAPVAPVAPAAPSVNGNGHTRASGGALADMIAKRQTASV